MTDSGPSVGGSSSAPEGAPTTCERCGGPNASEVRYLRDDEWQIERLCERCRDRYLERVRASAETRERDARRRRLRLATIGWLLVLLGVVVVGLAMYGGATR